MTSSINPSVVFFVSILLSGCISTPDQPTIPPMKAGGGFLAADAALSEFNDQWWTQFDDTAMSGLIGQSLLANKSLDVAAANIRIAEATAAGQRLSRTYSTGTTTSAALGRASRAGQGVEVSAQAGLGASWEFDAFGRIEAQIAAAEFDVEATRQARRDVAVIVASQTALTYVQLRGAQRRLEVARKNASTQAEGLELLQTLLDNGSATQLDVERAEAQYRTTLASLPTFEATIQTSVSGLAVLTGQPAYEQDQTLNAFMAQSGDIPEHRGAIATGSVDDLIRRRPDIRQAEAVIARQLALGEAARADLFPTVTLNADILTLFDGTNDVGDLTSLGFGIGPSITWAGPDLRRVRANIDVSDARTDFAMANYEQIVLAALSEVEIALTNYAKELERRDDLRQAAQSARRSLTLARLRFEEGLDDYLDVLDAQRTLLDADDRLAESRFQSSARAITAYRTLGGVWTSADVAETATEIALD